MNPQRIAEGSAEKMPGGKKRVWWFVRALVIIGVMDALLFGVAGRIDWPGAWVLTFLFFTFLVMFLVWATRNAPELLDERSRVAANAKAWDKVILRIYNLVLLGLLVTAALDAGRFRWSAVPAALQVAGAVAFVPITGVIWWCAARNAFLSRGARIQKERGHRVVESGPYRFIRHPMYAAIIVLMPCVALVLGSWWALIPAGLIGVLFVVRTALEDRMLMQELEGYREYAGRVRYRLARGVW